LRPRSREFIEETGMTPRPPFVALAPLKQKGGKVIHCWAFEGEDEDVAGPTAFPRRTERHPLNHSSDDACW